MANINHAFAINFYNALKATEGNFFFSPYSILTAFAMTYAGARGETEEQIAKVFGFSSQKKFHTRFSQLKKELKTKQQQDDVVLLTANSLYPQIKYLFLDSFLELLNHYYQAKITAVDYRNKLEAAQTINQWVAEQTQKKITELIPADTLNELTRLILVNAVYFKGKWTSPFEEESTATEPFWVTSEHQIEVSIRLSLDYEQLPEISEAMIYAAMIRLMLRRLASSSS